MLYVIPNRQPKAKPFEQSLVALLTSKGIPAGLNPYSGTSNPARPDYDLWTDIGDKRLLIEAKLDIASQLSGNICLELEALHHSKAPLFVYGLPEGDITKTWCFHVWEPENLATATKMTDSGRVYRYRHLNAGDQVLNECVLIPKKVLEGVGRPFEEAIDMLVAVN